VRNILLSEPVLRLVPYVLFAETVVFTRRVYPLLLSVGRRWEKSLVFYSVGGGFGVLFHPHLYFGKAFSATRCIDP